MGAAFAVPVFFVAFRETLEIGLLVSIVLVLLSQNIRKDAKALHRQLRNQLLLGTLAGIVFCLVVGCALIGAFYGLGQDGWSNSEEVWEGVFAIISAVMISVVCGALLHVSKRTEYWSRDMMVGEGRKQARLWKAALFFLAFATVLREGLELMTFIGDINLGFSAKSIPLPTICGLVVGIIISIAINLAGTHLPTRIVQICAVCFLYLHAAGLFSRGIWYFEAKRWDDLTGGDASEADSGPGSYDIRQSVWHLNAANPQLNGGGGWSILNGLVGWQNSATYGSVIGYNLYWLAIIISFAILGIKDGGKSALRRNAAQQQRSNEELKTNDTDVSVKEVRDTLTPP